MTPANPARMLTTERWARIEEIFHRARNEHDGARDQILERLCNGDDELLTEVRALLFADAETNRPRPAAGMRTADLSGRRVGNYQLDSLLGTGGMGSVYLAHRCDGQFDRQVAFKILGANLRNEFFTDRFAVERQLLAALDHPNITRLLDSGVNNLGDPYLVLEYVAGQPIDEYCDQQSLGVNDRIRLFLQVCTAVEFAHSRRVLHRDLKPSNIFVMASPEGDGCIAKLLDFGTAKLLEPASRTDATATRFRMMTPRYASPEQLRGDPQTPATDVYSLGIVLYELLTGAWPFGDPQSVISGLERAVREVEPKHPRTGIDDEVAARRGISAKELIDVLSGDLWKVMRKAIQADTESRYSSVRELSSDLQRCLQNAPVLARSQTLAGWTRKFVRRHPAGAVLTLIAMLGICAAGTSAYRNWRSANRPPPSIAVLPFTNATADSSSAQASLYLRSGMTDEITDALSRLKGFKVVSRAAVAQVAVKPIDTGKIGRALNVTHLLESSIERAGDQITVVASLIRTSDRAPLWTDRYQRKVTEISAIEADLEVRIIDSLGISRPAKSRHVAPNDAHDVYLRARLEGNQQSLDANAQAQRDFRRAIEMDPEYAQAYAGLAAAMWNRNGIVVGRPNWKELKQVEQLLQKAIELDPGLAAPHYGLGLYASQYDWDWNRAEREFRASLAAGQNAGGEFGLTILYLVLGRRQEADEHLRRARDLDPFSNGSATNTAIALHLEGRIKEEREIYGQMAAQNPTVPALQIRRTAIDADEGDANALESLRKLVDKEPSARLALASAEATAGNREEALRVLRPLEEHYEQGNIPMFQFARIHATLGDEAETVKWLVRSMEGREAGATYVRVEPVFAKMQDSPAFRALKQRMGLPQ